MAMPGTKCLSRFRFSKLSVSSSSEEELLLTGKKGIVDVICVGVGWCNYTSVAAGCNSSIEEGRSRRRLSQNVECACCPGWTLSHWRGLVATTTAAQWCNTGEEEIGAPGSHQIGEEGFPADSVGE